MSEQPFQVPDIPLELPDIPSKPQTFPQEKPVSLQLRILFVAGFVLIIAVMLFFSPKIAQQIAYAWNIGAERAKADVARQFLAEHPYSQQRIAWVANAVAPNVVGIRIITTTRRGNLDFVDAGLVGSGVIVDEQNGYILTNYHVIENARDIYVRFNDGREITARIVGLDRLVDFAVLQIDAENIQSIPWGDSTQVAVGDQVVAIGHPFALQQTVTSGIISAPERYHPSQTQGIRRGTRPVPYAYLQTDAAINPGNSGGALVDMDGKLIGICTAIISADNGGNSGIGFAIPSSSAKRIYDDILSGEVKHGWIGVRLETVSLFEARQMNQTKPMGASVTNFMGNRSPARDAGIQRGDIILRWGETEIKEPLHLTHLVTLTKPGTKETVKVFRSGEILTLEITVGVRPTDL